MPNRVKALKKTLLKFEKQSGEEQNNKSKQKLMVRTCLTYKFSKDLVADTLTINSAIANRDNLKCRKDSLKAKGEILPPLQEEQKSVRL